MNPTTITLRNLAWDTAADIHLPPGFDPTKAYPTVLTAHPIGSCKEQTSGNVYAKALAEAGFIAVAFDASFQGDSGGEPRRMEDPALRVSDFRFVIDHLVTLPYVDSKRIGALGICGGGGYTVAAAATDRRIKSVVSITGVNFGRLMREGFSAFNPVAALDAMAAQRTAEARGTPRQIIDYLPASVAAAKAAGVTDIDLLEATDYYRSPRAHHANGEVTGLFSFNSAAMAWDAFAHVELLLTQPLMVVVGDQVGGFGAYRDGCEVHGRAASKHKELVVLPGVSHYALYDQPEAVGPALAKVIPFLQATL